MKLIFIFLALLFLFSFSFALTEINSCQNLTIQDETYIINTSFSGSDNCIFITNTGIILNGNGTTITGTGTTNSVVRATSGIGYTVGNLTIAGSLQAFEIAGPSNFSNIEMRDINLVSTADNRYINMIRGNFPIIGNNLSMINITSYHTSGFLDTIGIIGCQVHVGGSGQIPSNCSTNRANLDLSNITFTNVSGTYNTTRGQVALGVFATTTWGGNTNQNQIIISNSQIRNITFNNVSINTASSTAGNLGPIAITFDSASSGTASLTLDNVNITGVNFTASNTNNGIFGGGYNCYGIVSICEGTAGSAQNLSYTNSNIELISKGITTSGSAINGLISGTTMTLTNISATSVPIILYNDTTVSPSITNYTATISTTSGIPSVLTINTANAGSFTVFDIPTIPADPTTAKNTSSYLNYSSYNSNVNLSLFYSAPSLPWLEQDIRTRSLSGSTWTQVAAGTLDTSSNKMTFDDLSIIGTTQTIGLFANDPPFIVSLNAPSNNIYTNSTSITFNWTTTGGIASYFSNLTINSIQNVTNIPTTNNTPTTQIVTDFIDGIYNWSISSYNTTLSNSSTTRTFTVDTVTPIIILNSPANATLTNSTLINFNFTQTDTFSPTSSCSIYIDNILTATNTTTLNATATIFPLSLSDGAHNWYLNCTDLAGNNNISETRIITINSVAPVISLESPTNNQVIPPGFILFSFNATSNLSSTMACSLFVDSIQVQTNSSVQNSTSTSFSQNVPVQALHNWQIQCTDTFSNLAGSEIRNFTVLQSGGGGGGGTPAETPPPIGNITNITTPLPELPIMEPTLNPPPQTAGVSQAVDTIVGITNGNIQSIPFSCAPYWQTNFNFIGAKFVDTLVCEYKGILSLYIQKIGSFPNLAMILILFLIILGSNIKDKTSPVFLSIIGIIIITAVIGADLIAFSTTAILLRGREFFG